MTFPFPTDKRPPRIRLKSRRPLPGVTHYGYRYYDPVKGRWPSRDPITEKGGLNLHGFLENDAVGFWDLLGLLPRCQDCESEFDSCADKEMTAYDDQIAHIERVLAENIAQNGRAIDSAVSACPAGPSIARDICEISIRAGMGNLNTVAQSVAAVTRATARGNFNVGYASCSLGLMKCSARRAAAKIACECK